jgi:hypothetical protein
MSRITGALAAGQVELTGALAVHERPSDREIAWLEQTYEGIARGAERLGASFVLVLFPYETQLAAGTPDDLQRRLLDLAQLRGWIMVDLLPAFRAAAARSSEPLFRDIWHPTAAGQRVAATALFDALVAKKLVPSR